MQKQIKLSDAIGKVFVGFAADAYNGQAVLKFEDETFATIGVRDYDGYFQLLEEQLDWQKFDQSTLVTTGIATKEEINTLKDQMQDRLDVKQLQKRFESPLVISPISVFNISQEV